MVSSLSKLRLIFILSLVTLAGVFILTIYLIPYSLHWRQLAYLFISYTILLLGLDSVAAVWFGFWAKQLCIMLIVVGIAAFVMAIIWGLIQPTDSLGYMPVGSLGAFSLFLGIVNILIFYVRKRKSHKRH